jgi:cysteine desulfurase
MNNEKKSVQTEKKFVYADNAATTRISTDVLTAMMPYLTENFGNPSSMYTMARSAKYATEKARENIAKSLNADPKEIFFTSGGSESDNWAIRGYAELQLKKGKNHIITSNFEHHAVLHTCEFLEKNGFEVTYLPVSSDGFVSPEDVKNAITDRTCLVTIMYVNNEIGTIQPIPEIAEICREKGVKFHTDAVQAMGNIPIDVKNLQVDFLSISGHKIHGPKGIGLLYVKKGIRLQNLIFGGGQERGRRAGTENVAGIIGLAKAIEVAQSSVDAKIAKLTPLRDKLIDNILKIEKTRLNGSRENRVCSNVNISIEGIEGESLLLSLDMFANIAASSGSACTSGSLDPSHVLLAIGLIHDVAHGSLRLSLSDENSEEDIDYILEKLPPIVEKLRAMSPLWERVVRSPLTTTD